ncbi:MAG: ABC transporter permease [Actinomycetota bacterium]
MSARPRPGVSGSRGDPFPLVVVGGFAAAFLALPLVALVLRAPWADLGYYLSSDDVRSAIGLSMVASLGATASVIVLGLPLAWLLARADFPGRSLLRGLTTLPLVLPPVVGGVALLLALGRLGIVGKWLNSGFGFTLFGTPAAVVIAEAFVAMPFFVLTVEASLRSMDTRYEDAAASLGAGSWTRFRRVTLPLIAPGLWSGAVLAWARALGEFGATITFAGNLPGRTQTIPIAVYTQLQKDVDGAIAISLVLVAVSLVVLVLLRDRWLGPS